MVDGLTRQIDDSYQREKHARKYQKAAPTPTAFAQGSRSVEPRLEELSGQIKEQRAAIEAPAKALEKK